MTGAPTVDETIALVQRVFKNVTDKAGEPYAEHCIRVMRGLPDDASDDEKHAALLHDVFEDTELNEEDLADAGYSQAVIDLVIHLTRCMGESYLAYVNRVAESPARRIKLADLEDNANPERLAKLNPHVRFRLQQKYAAARSFLNWPALLASPGCREGGGMSREVGAASPQA